MLWSTKQEGTRREGWTVLEVQGDPVDEKDRCGALYWGRKGAHSPFLSDPERGDRHPPSQGQIYRLGRSLGMWGLWGHTA